MSPSEFVQQLVNALSLGSIYALLALGLSMVYGVLGMLNFAYGELVTICAYTMLLATRAGAPFVVVAIVGVIAACVASVLMELVAFRPLRRASFVTLLFTSFAVSQLIQNGFRQAYSVRSKGIPVPELFDRGVSLGSIRIGALPMITAAIGGISLLVLTAFLRRSRSGLAMRAAAQDFTTARLNGVRANRVISLAFAISGALAGIAGVLWVARTTSVNPTSGFVPVIEAFIASVIGGLGNLRGAVIGGFFLGTLEVFLHATLPGLLLPYAQAASLLVIVVILYVRPQGLSGGRAEAVA
jgi:branched-chain amino acid transport system permease protein